MAFRTFGGKMNLKQLILKVTLYLFLCSSFVSDQLDF